MSARQTIVPYFEYETKIFVRRINTLGKFEYASKLQKPTRIRAFEELKTTERTEAISVIFSISKNWYRNQIARLIVRNGYTIIVFNVWTWNEEQLSVDMKLSKYERSSLAYLSGKNVGNVCRLYWTPLTKWRSVTFVPSNVFIQSTRIICSSFRLIFLTFFVRPNST